MNPKYSQEDYIQELNTIKSEVIQILKTGSDDDISRAADYFPGKLNHILLQQDLESAIMIIDIPVMFNRRKDIELIDLNSDLDDIGKLNEVIQKIEEEIGLIS